NGIFRWRRKGRRVSHDRRIKSERFSLTLSHSLWWNVARPQFSEMEEPMSLSEVLLIDFDHEMANTRKTLERVPAEKPDWKPHAKSMPLGRLANHVAELPTWAIFTVERDSLDIAPPGAPEYQPPPPAATRQELLEKFDKNVVAARASLSG